VSQNIEPLRPSRDKTHSAIEGLLAFVTGVRLGAAGELEGARHAYSIAVQSGDSMIAAQAHLQLGILLYQHGAFDDAKTSFERAVESGDMDAAPRARNGIGVVCAVQGDTPGAQAAYSLAIDSRHFDAAPKAARNLGLLLKQEHRDLVGARAAFVMAVESGHVEIAPLAANNLGNLLQDIGDLQGAEQAYLRAAFARDPITAAKAARHLGQLHEMAGDKEGSKNALRCAAAIERPGSGAYLAPLDESIALATNDDEESNLVIDRFLESDVFALGRPAGDLSVPGQGTESDLLHFTVDLDGSDQVLLPVFTQPALMRQALLRNPDWQTLSVLEVHGRALYENIADDVTVVINPWSRLEFQLKRKIETEEIHESGDG